MCSRMSRQPLTATDEFHIRKVDEWIKNYWQITPREIAVKLAISQEHVGHIDVLQYQKACAR